MLNTLLSKSTMGATPIGLAVAAMTGLGAFAPAQAVTAPEIALSARAEVTLAADKEVVAPGDPVTLVLAQYLSPGWHSYWRNPGDSGMETTIAWSGLAGDPSPIEIGAIEWPAPTRIPVPPLMNFGFKDEAILISAGTVPEDWPVGEPIHLEAQADWLVCEEICVPESQKFTLTLPTGPESRDDAAIVELVARGRSSQPAPFEGRALFDEAEGAARVFLAEPSLAEAARGGKTHFFVNEWGVDIPAAEQKVEIRPDGLLVRFERGETETGQDLHGVLKIETADGAAPLALQLVAERGAIPAAPAGGAAAGGGSGGGTASVLDLGLGLGASPAAAALLAFLGGLVLNLMPCVFPVLALKALSLARGADAPMSERLAHGGAYAGGVLALFLIFAGALIAFKAAGEAVGWGFQLQSPVVVVVLALGLFAVALNLSGVFEIGGVAFSGSGAATRSSVGESALTGALAAIVASPCTAPFMGAALGYALTQSAAVTLVVFAALALGFAAPIVLLAAAPGVARRLPRPGPWMTRFRQALAFPLYLTAAWLAWVLGAQAGPDAVFALLAGFVLLGAGAWALGVGWPAGASSRVVATTFAVLALIGAAATPLAWTVSENGRESAPRAFRAESGRTAGAPLDLQRLAELQAQNQVVFVNVTADWCISCKVNERLVLSGESFEQMLESANAVYLKGDWTRRDAELGEFLRSHGRVGVPLYLVYRPGSPPEILPQILTQDIVRRALGLG